MSSSVPPNAEPSPRAARSSGAKRTYLLTYNFVSTILWAAVLGRVVLTVLFAGWQQVYKSTGDFAFWTQLGAVAEVGHAALGLVRAPLPTTAMQVASRLLLVSLARLFPRTASSTPFYTTMLLAWSVTEVIRYAYFVCVLWGASNPRSEGGSEGRGDGVKGSTVPAWLSWLRYNTFFVLYPLGISSEAAVVWKAVGPAGRVNLAWAYFLKAVLAVYVPGSYILYTHMMAQRRKVMRGKQKAEK
ncbi:hypothetical protein H2201_006798 [Coniosporium apollinis]|uniref:Very-long-chain (3R)-3-hydroxyacyl-CoA dehydratase n=1 Tax=Coniosporium apollinis TaxID=61459 RepID=A0ABQ9NN99_9PEZI|nr:hypothetical protein H2201_006798 [Coniosporium apollinis]